MTLGNRMSGRGSVTGWQGTPGRQSGRLKARTHPPNQPKRSLPLLPDQLVRHPKNARGRDRLHRKQTSGCGC